MFTLIQIQSLIGGALTMMVLGSLYVFGSISPYISSYLHYQGSNISTSSLSIIQTISIITTNLGMPISNLKFLKFNHKITSLISIIGISLTIFLLSFCSSFALYIILYGFVFGIFIGFGYMSPVKNCYQHIPLRKGLGSGFCIGGFGLGAVVFNTILLRLINPDNHKQISPPDGGKYFDQHVAHQLPYALKIISACYLGIGLLGVSLIRPIKKSTQLTSSGEINQSLQPVEESIQIKRTFQQSVLFYIEKKAFLLVLTLVLAAPYGVFVAFSYKQFGLTAGIDDKFLTIIGSIGGVANGLSRVFWGILMDIFSFKIISTAINTILFICSCSIFFAVKNQYVYMLCVFLTYFCYGGLFGIYPTQTVRIFGKVKGSRIYWKIFSGFSFAAIIQYLLHNFIIGGELENKFLYCFIAFALLSAGGVIVSLIVTYKLDTNEIKKTLIEQTQISSSQIYPTQIQ